MEYLAKINTHTHTIKDFLSLGGRGRYVRTLKGQIRMFVFLRTINIHT